MKRWQLQEAKARLSQLVRDAAEEPQEISVHGKPVAVVVSQERYARLTADKPSFVRFLRDSPLFGEDFPIDRDKSPTRRVDL
jgi:prevent-host-death family protein